MYYFARVLRRRARPGARSSTRRRTTSLRARAPAGRLTADEQAAAWTRTADALATVGFGDEKAEIAALAAVLQLTQLRFDGADSADGVRVGAALGVGNAATALRVDGVADDGAVLAAHRAAVRRDLRQGARRDDAQHAAHALAKALYGRMFDAVVSRINALWICRRR